MRLKQHIWSKRLGVLRLVEGESLACFHWADWPKRWWGSVALRVPACICECADTWFHVSMWRGHCHFKCMCVCVCVRVHVHEWLHLRALQSIEASWNGVTSVVCKLSHTHTYTHKHFQCFALIYITFWGIYPITWQNIALTCKKTNL